MAHQKVKRTALQPTGVFSPTNHPGDVGFSFAATSAAKKQCPGIIFRVFCCLPKILHGMINCLRWKWSFSTYWKKYDR